MMMMMMVSDDRLLLQLLWVLKLHRCSVPAHLGRLHVWGFPLGPQVLRSGEEGAHIIIL